MKIITGKSISPGYAQGRAVVLGYDQKKLSNIRIDPDDVDTELARFHCAIEESCRELTQLHARVQSELGAEAADIFTAHLLFLEDRQFIDRVETCIRNDQLSLESAIQVTIDEHADLLNEADSAFLRERAADVRDLQRRLFRHVAQSTTEQLVELAHESVLVARELLPSDLLEFDHEHLVGIITETGGETGHAAILARALGIPAVTGITDVMRLIKPDMPILIDGQTGEVVLEPVPERFQVSIENKKDYDQVSRNAINAEDSECLTLDGLKVQLFANIGRPFEVSQVAGHNLEGVGLFRTEYLFLDEPVEPSFARQRDIYCQVASSLNGLPLVIRTLDLGGDKWPSFLKPRFEDNPNLGVRGLRFSLVAAEQLFRTQIRAALYAANEYNVRIMFPMVLGCADLQHAISIIRDVAEKDGISNLPPVGALIETPSAVFAIEDLRPLTSSVSELMT